ncbi:nicotinate phosphoribosyltransferase [Ensifer sp. ENS10]|uniref:nicotinate phosphoribosyltransferase n=1 Tax=Ensifer sp. ENS10 TaxID=2769286 RepID=UPI001787158F|nr:nicotinate phosphoribosyltransferase [Ensifer sp. ENS10]MBD9511561.1 nicotinate phosphoribosyltransferase [Ensifer sp. ENS10]
MTKNIILSTDSYKHSHFLQYPHGAQFVSSYIEARRGSDKKQITQFFGLQAFIKEYLMKPITEDMIFEAAAQLEGHGLPFNDSDWAIILDEHRGFLPIEIQALPEGAIVPRGTPMIQVRNTDPRFPWLTSFVETALLRAIWYPSSVATLSFITKAIIYDALKRTSDDPDGQIPFKLHDFGARGVSSGESAGIGGAAHLLNFKGTDTLEALQFIDRFYYPSDTAGFSIPASEHSTMTSWGKEQEAEAYENMMDEFGHGLFSIVSDSYDLFNAIENIFGDRLKGKILELDGKLVIRPDSGDPVATPVAVVKKLWEIFGGTTNSKGYKVLNPKVGVIQGDGMNGDSIGRLVTALVAEGFSIDNIAFGMGGGLLQGHMRDDMRFAMKANAIDFGSGWVDVQKKPATDPSKASKAGRQAVVLNDGELEAIREEDLGDLINELRTVYKDGRLLQTEYWDELTAYSHLQLVNFCNVVRKRTEEEQAAAA